LAAYRTDEGKPWVLPVVRKMEERLAADQTLNKEYLPVLGLEAAAAAATSMLLGADNPAILQGRVTEHYNVPNIISDSNEIDQIHKIKFLGLIIHDGLTWDSHIDHVVRCLR
jgi:aspartate aminotransferase